MFIFENNFNLLSPHFGKKATPTRTLKTKMGCRKAVPAVYALDGCV